MLPFFVHGFLICSTTMSSPPGRKREYSSRDVSSKFGTEQRTRMQTIVSKIPWGDALTPSFARAASSSVLSAVQLKIWYFSASLASLIRACNGEWRPRAGSAPYMALMLALSEKNDTSEPDPGPISRMTPWARDRRGGISSAEPLGVGGGSTGADGFG